MRLPVTLKPILSKCGTCSVPEKERAICANDSLVIMVGDKDKKNLRTIRPKVCATVVVSSSSLSGKGCRRAFRCCDGQKCNGAIEHGSNGVHLNSLFLHVRGGYGPAPADHVHGYGSACFTRAPDRLYRGPTIASSNITHGDAFYFLASEQ